MVQNPIFLVVEKWLYLVKEILAEVTAKWFFDRNATNGWLYILVGQSITVSDNGQLMTAWRSADEVNELHR
jgi:hypothetical protein